MRLPAPESPEYRPQIIPLEQDCLEWVKQRLPAGLPPSARRAAIRYLTEWLGPGFWRSLSLDYQGREFTAQDLQELRFRLFRTACREAAHMVAASEGSSETDRWRYSMSPRGTAARPLYRENLNYEFNAIYDQRKLWFEFQLQLERTVLPADRVAAQAAEYEQCLNKWFRVPHWRWDPQSFTFAEISDSKQVDGNGVEQPNEKTYDGLIDRYAR